MCCSSFPTTCARSPAATAAWRKRRTSTPWPRPEFASIALTASSPVQSVAIVATDGPVATDDRHSGQSGILSATLHPDFVSLPKYFKQHGYAYAAHRQDFPRRHRRHRSLDRRRRTAIRRGGRQSGSGKNRDGYHRPIRMKATPLESSKKGDASKADDAKKSGDQRQEKLR